MAVQNNNLVVIGGMTASCTADSVAHSLNLDSESGTPAAAWTSASPGALHRRRGAAAAPIGDGKVLVIGGLADKSVCHNSASAYAGVDSMTVPVTASTSVSSTSLPASLTGTKLAVSDFALASTGNTVYLAGGQSADGSLVGLDTIGVWSEGGWATQKVKGDIPAGRLGATLVAHPTMDMLILHGGSELQSGKYAPAPLLATLNTKTWEWSQPTGIKPTSGVSYHTSVMTPSGVMITAFGMGNSGSPVSNVQYLDMRGSVDQWAWTNTWSSSMLNASELPPNAQAAAEHKSGKGKTAAIAVPVVLLTLILIPISVWLYRRYQKNQRKRRLASHFSFSTQEDNGHFRNFDGGRRNRTAYPFGRETSENSWRSDMRSAIDKVFRRGSTAHGVGDDGTIASRERELIDVDPAELTEKNWEEIDFGLGRVDQDRREATYTDLPARRGTPRQSLPMPRTNSFEHPGSPTPGQGQIPFPMPIASTLPYDAPLVDVDMDTDSPRLGSPRSDGQQLLSPQPEQSPFRDSMAVPESGLSAAAADAAAVDDWNALAASIESRPVFRPISPTAQLGSHHHSGSVDSHASDSSSSTAPVLPHMEFTGSPMMKNASIGRSTMASTRTARTRAASGQRVVSAGPPPAASAQQTSPTRHLAGARRSSVASERRVSAGTFNKRLSPLRVVNADDQ